MAAAVVPSRARAAARTPNPVSSTEQDSTVTYIRMTLVVDSLQAPTLPSGQYYFRWMRGGKLVKRTSARSLDSSSFAQKMALYASVKRQGVTFVSDNQAEPLQTSLELIQLDPANPNTAGKTIATAPFDVAHFLALIVDHGHSKSLNTTLNFSTDISANVSLSVKLPGGGNLAPVEMPKEQHPVHLPPDDEAMAAIELEKLRRGARDVRDARDARDAREAREERVDRRASDMSAEVTAQVTALKARVQTLEQQKAVVDREKAEAERKVAAHVAHASKIKATYNQLAGWYNNLRQEHAEYQRKHPSSSMDMESSRDIPNTVVSTHGADVESLEKERDELRVQLERERSEKREMHTHNSELLESRTRTLTELREQWDNAQMALVAAQKSREEQSTELRNMHERVLALQSQLDEKDGLVKERSVDLSKTSESLRQIEASHEDSLRQARVEGKEEAMQEAQNEIEELRKQIDQDSEKRFEEVKATHEEELQIKLSRVREEHKQELIRMRAEIEAEQNIKLERELHRLRNEGEEAKVMLSEQATLEAQKVEGAMKIRIEELEKERTELQEQLNSRMVDMDTNKADKESDVTRLKEVHQKELDDMNTLRAKLEQELNVLKEEVESDKLKSAKALEGERNHSSEIEQELSSVRAELDSLKKVSQNVEVSSREALEGQKENEELVESLQKEVSFLKEELEAEKEKLKENERFTYSVESERMEMRAIVARLRNERDGALADLKQMKEVAQRQGGPDSARQIGGDTEPENLEEERDKAIRELFRVRKGLNKEIRRLKKENAELADKVQNSSQEVGENDSGDLNEFRAQLDLLTSKNRELEEAMSLSRQKHDQAVEELSRDRDSLTQALQEARNEVSSSSRGLETKEEKIQELLVIVQSSNQKCEDFERQKDQAKQEQNEANSKANMLRIELEELKESLATAASSSSSAEALLTASQREAAEAKARIEQLNGEVKELSKGKSQLEERFRKHEAIATQKQARLQDLEVLNASLTEKLSSEAQTKTELRSRIESMEAETLDLRESQRRLKVVEAKLTERDNELSEAQQIIRNLELSEEKLRKESEKLHTTRETVSKLEAELLTTKSQLEEKSKELQSEINTRSRSDENESVSLSDAQREKEVVAVQLAQLQVKYDASQTELQTAQESYSNLEAVLKKVQEKATRLGKAATEKTRECNELNVVVSELRADSERSNANYASLEEQHLLAKRELSVTQQETSNLKAEKMGFADRIKSLEEEIGTMNERISFIQEENEEEIVALRNQNEKEGRKANDMRKELQTARAEAESLQAQVEQLRGSNAELRKAQESLKENRDAPEADVLNDLIKARLDLAYATEETIRLRNKLKKLGQSSTGNVPAL